jgi:hypothetical protein
MRIIEFCRRHDLLALLMVIGFMALVYGLINFVPYVTLPCSALHGQRQKDCVDYQAYLSWWGDRL